MVGADELEGGVIRRQHARLDPQLILEDTLVTDADRTGIATSVALDTLGELAVPEGHPLIETLLQQLAHVLVNGWSNAFHLLSRINLLRVWMLAATFYGLGFRAGQPDQGEPVQVHLLAFGHLDESPLVAAPDHHAQPTIGEPGLDQLADVGQRVLRLQNQLGQVILALKKTWANAAMLFTQAKHTIHLTAGQQLTSYLTHLLNEVLHLHPQ